MGPIRKGKPSKHFLAWDGKRVRLIDFPSMVKSVRQSGKEVFKHAALCRVCALLCAVLYAVREIDKVSKLFVVVDGLRMFPAPQGMGKVRVLVRHNCVKNNAKIDKQYTKKRSANRSRKKHKK